MTRNRLMILASAGTAAASAWGAVLLPSGEGAGDGSVAPPVSSSTTTPSDDAPEMSPATVPPELRVPTIAPGDDGTPRGGSFNDVANTPSAAAAAFVRTMWTYDAAIDTTSHDAAGRAARWATSSLAATLVRPATRTTPSWEGWARHGAYTWVDLTSAATPGQDVATERLRTYGVDVRVVGDDGFRDRLDRFLITATVVHEDRRWLVEGITLT